MAIDAQETVVLTATFEDDTGTKVDPIQPVEVTITGPNGTDGPYSASKSSVGVYEYTYDVGPPGTYYVKFTSDDGAVVQDDFDAAFDRTD